MHKPVSLGDGVRMVVVVVTGCGVVGAMGGIGGGGNGGHCS
jgi:hypothetical protein